MPEIDPITREEKLWSGEDIEPITREEMYIKHIYDKTQKIPSKPITRKEMLLEKAGQGGGGDVTIKQLSVTANGTYSEENTAYSPVIVNVPAPPIPDNAYLLNEVEGLPKDIVTFDDGSFLPMPSLKVGIEPVQEGSGDPSPENVRHISGHTEANVVVSPTTDAEDGTTYNIQFKDGDNPLTVYGGTLDVVSGELTVDMVSVDLGKLNWRYSDSRKAFNVEIPEMSLKVLSVIASCYAYYGVITSASQMVDIPTGNLVRQRANQQIFLKDDRYTDVTALKDAIGGQIMVYTLATPLEVQLTPTQVKSLLGTNNVWADTGDIEELEYFSKEA